MARRTAERSTSDCAGPPGAARRLSAGRRRGRHRLGGRSHLTFAEGVRYSTVDPVQFTIPPSGLATWTGSPGTPSSARVLFGIRPCDARALAALHRFAAGHRPHRRALDRPPGPDEPRRRRVRRRPLAGCLPARASGGDPADRSHVDVLLVPAPGGFAVDPVTFPGWALLASARGRVRSSPQPLPRATPPRRVGPGRTRGRRATDDPIWAEIADRCPDGGTCAEECPIGAGSWRLRRSSARLARRQRHRPASPSAPAPDGIRAASLLRRWATGGSSASGAAAAWSTAALESTSGRAHAGVGHGPRPRTTTTEGIHRFRDR